jgi:uncharacterized protein involved in response to NO
MSIAWNRFRQEPYRLLFPLGILFGCAGVAHWLLYALGVSNASPFYHASLQLGAYLYCFIVGFLWTAMPRMAGAPPASRMELLMLSGLLAAQTVLQALGKVIAAQVCFAGLLVLLALFALRRMAARRGSAQGPTEFIWVLIGVGFGLAGSGLMVAGSLAPLPLWVVASGRMMAQQGFTLSIIVGVAGFMAPRLMGRAAPLVQVGLTPDQVGRARRKRLAGHLLAALVLGVSFLVEGAGYIRAAYALRAIVVTVELGYPARLWKVPVIKDLYVRLLWLSLWFIVIGLWAVVCWPLHRVAMLHLVLIGGFSLMIFAVATMVVLSHAGQAQALRKPLWILRVVAAGVIGATAARVLANFWVERYFALLAAAAMAWLAAGVSWLIFVLPWVLRAAPEGEFERMHAEAKQRLLHEGGAQRC